MTLDTFLRTLAASITRLVVRPASAHCDTADGPAVADGRRALATGRVNIALKWVQPEGEAELRGIFERAAKVRAAGAADDDAAALAEQWFLENLVRIHRAGEGAGYDGIKPAGTAIPAPVRAADEALERGSIEPLRGLIDAERWPELQKRFDKAIALKQFNDDDLPAARTYMDAYVSFFKFAEGHDHEHAQHAGHRAHAHADAHAHAHADAHANAHGGGCGHH